MTPPPIRDLAPADLDWVLEVNRVHEHLLSPLDRDGLAVLVAGARLARVIGPGSAFLVAFDQDAAYSSPNFHWFRARYQRFLYVDRVAVAPAAAGAGHGRRLYTDLFARAATLGHDIVCAEVNSEPPNHASLAFHDRQGFHVVGEQSLPDRGKSVRYFVKAVAPAP